jgi:serine/threonine protein kinase
MTTIDDHRWHLPAQQFARRLDLDDVETFFHENLLIEEGTRALVLENGQHLGEVPSGQYTLASFSERLPDWSQQHATVILIRVPGEQLEISCQNIPTRDNIQVNVFFHLQVSVKDPESLLQNMPGSNSTMAVEKLQETIQAILQMATWETIKVHSLKDLGQDLGNRIQENKGMQVRLDAKGIQLVQLQLFSFQQVESEAVERVKKDLVLDGIEVVPQGSDAGGEALQLRDDQLVLDGHEVQDSLDNEATSMSSMADDSARSRVSLGDEFAADSTLLPAEDVDHLNSDATTDSTLSAGEDVDHLNVDATTDSTLSADKDEGLDIFDGFDYIANLETHYDILEDLGAGGFGTVRKAVEKLELGRTVALKFLHRKYRGNRKALLRFMKEAKSISKFEHNNIVRIHALHRSAEGPFIVMEYIEGGSLADRLKEENSLEPEEAVRIICEVCKALSMAHNKGLTHRDIKPANILMTLEGVPKLSDFGLVNESQSEVSISEKGATLGTINYMAPEQRLDASQADARSDLWSLAATLYECVTGEIPQMINLEMVPRALRATLVMALETQPDKRHEDVSAFSRALQDAIRDGAEIGKDLDVGQCNQCYQSNGSKAQFCKGCGNSLKNTCPNSACNKVVGCWELFCQKCGENINEMIEKYISALDLTRFRADELEKQNKFTEANEELDSITDSRDYRITMKTQWVQEYRDKYERKGLESLKSKVKHLRQQEMYEEVLRELDPVPVITNPDLKDYIPWFGDFRKTCHDEQLQSQRANVAQLRSENRYVEAIELLESIPPIEDVRLKEHEDWIEEYKKVCFDELENLNQQCNQLISEARSIADQGDWQGAIRILENLPDSHASVKTDEMVAGWQQNIQVGHQQKEEIERLRQEIEQLEGAKDYAGALLLVEQFLELQPDDEEAREQADKLQSRIDFQTRTREWRQNRGSG